MTTQNRSRGLAVVLFLAFGLAGPLLASASAQSLDDLRASGTVGEGPDGLVVVRDPEATDAVKAIVAGINDKRLAIYRQRAAEQSVGEVSVTVVDVGRIYAAKIREEAPVGTWFRDPGGKWSQKPPPPPPPPAAK